MLTRPGNGLHILFVRSVFTPPPPPPSLSTKPTFLFTSKGPQLTHLFIIFSFRSFTSYHYHTHPVFFSLNNNNNNTMGNEQSVLHEPSPYADACKPQPMKSALRRTKSNGYCTMSSGGGHHDLLSVSRGSTCATDSDSTTASSVVTATRSPSTSPRPLAATAKTAPIPAAPATAAACPVPSAQQQQKPRYLPNMQPAGKSLLVPTRPFGHPGFPHHQHRQSDPGPNGTAAAATAAAAAEMSPQWGWYINTTPPTPEMYHSSSTLGGPGSGYPPHKMLTGATFPHQLAAANAATGRGGTAGAGSTTNVKPRLSSAAAGGGTVHNPVFQHLQQANNQHNNMGWTPVPI